MHMFQNLFYLTTALHVSAVTITHLRETPETCRAVSDTINSVTCASCWDLYIRILLRCCTDHWTLFKCVCKICFFSDTRKLWRLQTLVNCVSKRYLKVTFSQRTRLGFRQICYKNIDQHCTIIWLLLNVSVWIRLPMLSTLIVYFFQSSATRSAMRQTSGFYCENKWRYELDGCRISDLRLFGPLKQFALFYGNSLLPWLFSVSYYVECIHCRERVGRCWIHWGRPWLSLLITGIQTRDLSNTKVSLLSPQNKNCCNILLHLEYQWITKRYLRETKRWRISSQSDGQVCGGTQNGYHKHNMGNTQQPACSKGRVTEIV
jgi:hypothetical protein